MKFIQNAIIITLFSLIACIKGFSQSTCGSLCTNPGFESGTGFWEYYTGTACQSTTSEPCNLVTGMNAQQHAIQSSGGFDPIVGGSILPVVPPGGGGKAMRIGDGAVNGSNASRVSISYTVTQATANFAYQYAVVLQEPQGGGSPHTDAQRPYFSINVYDENGNAISCGDLFVLAKPPFTDFKETGFNTKIWYRNWTKAVISLSAYIGKCVRIEFTATDCTLTDHYGYAYIDASCDALDLIVSSSNACGGYTLTGPAKAMDYTWTNITIGGTTGIDGPNNTQTINVNRSGTYQLIMSSPLGPSCFTKLTIAVDSGISNPVNFTPNTGCSSITTQFTDISTPGGPITKWDWDFDNDGVTDNTTKNPSYNFPAGGTYPVTLTITVGTCTAWITKDVTVSLPTLPQVDPAGPFCLNSSPVNLITTMPGGTWTGKGITNATAGSFDPALANTGDNTIVYSTAASCPGRDTIIIHIDAPLSGTGPNLTLCSGTIGNLGIAPTAGNNYNWSPSTGLSSSTISNPTINLINNGKTPQSILFHLITTVAATGCYSSDSVMVTINSLPLVNAGINQTICVGNTVNLSGTVAGSTTSYTWSGGTGTFTPNNITLNSVYTPGANDVTAGDVTLTLTTDDPAGPCPSATDQMSVHINSGPLASVGPDQTICAGSTVNLAGVLGGSATIGTWTGGTGTYNPNNTTPTAIYTSSASEEAAGFVTLKFAANDPVGLCSTASGQMNIFIKSKSTAYAGLNRELCNGSTIQLAGSLTGNGTTATWSGGLGTFDPDNKTVNAVYTPSTNELTQGAISLTLTTDPIVPCPASSDQMVITIKPIANVNAGPDQSICVDPMIPAGNTVTLAGTFGGAATSGLWTGGQGTFSPSNTDPNAVYTLGEGEPALAAISLAFTTNDPIGPCPTVSDQMIILISQLPKVNAGPDQTVCAGSTVILGGSVSGSATSVIWSGGAGTFNPDNTSINTIYTPTTTEVATGSILLTLTTNDPIGPCVSASDQMQIFINPVATVNAGPDQIICAGDQIKLDGTIGGSATSGTWTGGTGAFSPNTTTANATYIPSLSETTAGNVTLTYSTDDPAGPCSSVGDQMNVVISHPPTANAGNTTPVCNGATIQLGGSIGGAATIGSWTGGTGTYVPNNTTLNARYTPTATEYAAGSITLTLTTNNPTTKCLPASSKVVLHFLPPPVVNFNVDSPSGCSIHCVAFTDSSAAVNGSSIIAWNWDFGDGGSSILKNPTHCYTQTGDFTVTLRVRDSKGCSEELTQDSIITVYKLPVAAFVASPNPISEIDPTVNFVNLSSPDVNYWFWDFGDGDTLSPNNSSPQHQYPAQTNSTFQPVLIVRNANLCYDTVSIGNQIRVGPQFSFYIPNAFSPDNKDGVNDYFFGQGIGIETYDMWIYDRWGNMVFHGDNINDKWDGKALNLTEFGGNKPGKKQAQMDVFVWRVVLSDVFGNVHNYNGTVTLIR
jgi:PKD repeat protein